MPISFGRYVVADPVADRLGKGAYGVVYRALDPKLNRSVAIKVLHVENQARSADSSRFFREARALAALQHPGVVPVFDFGEEEGTFYLVLAYFAGGTLQTLLKDRLTAGLGPFSPAETLALLEPICGGLSAAHAQGMIHRDLKPGNILLDHEGRPAIADFGLVHLLDEEFASSQLTQSGDVMGTPAYMAPEQWEPESHAITPRADLYSLGCIVYHLLVGHPPFQGSSAVQQARHLSAPPPRPSEVRQNLAEPWDDAVLCLMAKDPKARFATAEAFLAWLRLALADEAPPLPVAPTAAVPAPFETHPPPEPPETLLGSAETMHSPPSEPAAVGGGWGRMALGTGLAALVALAGWHFWPTGTTKPTTVPAATSVPATAPPSAHTAPNSLGQRFVAVTAPGEAPVDFAIWETRVQDFRAFRNDRVWQDPAVPTPAQKRPDWANPGFKIDETHPVVFVSWDDAAAFCRWLTATEQRLGSLPAGLEYRLPTEAEWHAAAGSEVHPWGSAWPPPPASGNYAIQSDWNWDDDYQFTAPVGSYRPNALGIHDLSGNVREWCLDHFRTETQTRAIRGGTYTEGGRAELRTNYRTGEPPGNRDAATGFRIVRAPVGMKR